MERFCTNCGNPLEEGTLFCPECGQKVEQPAAPEMNFVAAAAAENAPAPAPAQPQAAPASDYSFGKPQQQPKAAPVYDYAAPAPEPAPAPQPAPAPAPVQPEPAAEPVRSDGGKSQIVSTGTYFWLMLVFAIPVIGFIIAVILAFAARKKSLKNWVRASLLWVIIGLICTVVLTLIGFLLLKDSGVSLENIDYNALVQSILDAIGK